MTETSFPNHAAAVALAVILTVSSVGVFVSFAPPGASPVGIASAQSLEWSTDPADMPTERNELTTAVVGGELYAIGGVNGSGLVTPVEKYDPETDTWTTVSPLQTSRYGAASAVVDGEIYVIGGQGSSGLLNTVEKYDPDTDTWTFVANISVARWRLGAAVIGGKIYAVGGDDEGLASGVNGTVEVYDPAADTWTVLSPLPQEKKVMAVESSNGKIYAMGGSDGTDGVTTNYEYDPDTDTWTQKAALPEMKYGMASAHSGGVIYLAGGLDSGGAISDTVFSYDVGSDSWNESLPVMPTNRVRLSGSIVGGDFYAVGGRNGDATYHTTNERLSGVGGSGESSDGGSSSSDDSEGEYTQTFVLDSDVEMISASGSELTAYWWDVTAVLEPDQTDLSEGDRCLEDDALNGWVLCSDEDDHVEGSTGFNFRQRGTITVRDENVYRFEVYDKTTDGFHVTQGFTAEKTVSDRPEVWWDNPFISDNIDAEEGEYVIIVEGVSGVIDSENQYDDDGDGTDSGDPYLEGDLDDDGDWQFNYSDPTGNTTHIEYELTCPDGQVYTFNRTFDDPIANFSAGIDSVCGGSSGDIGSGGVDDIDGVDIGFTTGGDTAFDTVGLNFSGSEFGEAGFFGPPSGGSDGINWWWILIILAILAYVFRDEIEKLLRQ